MRTRVEAAVFADSLLLIGQAGLAQVHATLAAASAAALNRDPGDVHEWRDAIGQTRLRQ
jgi:hypothetical protein